MPDASDRYYLSLGRMICRAAESEVMLEALARELHPEKVDGWFSAGKSVAAAVTQGADRWPNQAMQIRELVEISRVGAEVRNWLVHAWVLSPVDSDWVELQKPVRKSVTWGQRRIYCDEIDLLAARFKWVLNAVTRVVNEHDWEQQGTRSYFAEPLPEPPPLPAFVERNEVYKKHQAGP